MHVHDVSIDRVATHKTKLLIHLITRHFSSRTRVFPCPRVRHDTGAVKHCGTPSRLRPSLFGVPGQNREVRLLGQTSPVVLGGGVLKGHSVTRPVCVRRPRLPVHKTGRPSFHRDPVIHSCPELLLMCSSSSWGPTSPVAGTHGEGRYVCRRRVEPVQGTRVNRVVQVTLRHHAFLPVHHESAVEEVLPVVDREVGEKDVLSLHMVLVLPSFLG